MVYVCENQHSYLLDPNAMAQEKPEDLSIEMLKKKKKNSLFLIGIMIGIILFTLIFFGISIVKGKAIEFASYIPSLILVFFSVIMYKGIKKIDKELKRRETIE